MIANNREPRQVTTLDLRRVIEPLAGYICAADQPKALLHLAWSVLFQEVAQVTREARAQVATFKTAKKVFGAVEVAGRHSTCT